MFKNSILDLRKLIISGLLMASPLAHANDPARIYYTEAKLQKAEQRIRDYRERLVHPPTLDVNVLKMEEKWLGMGFTSFVYGGKMNGKDVVVKFYRDHAIKSVINDQHGLTRAFLKQNYFMLETISDLGLAPKPYALLDQKKTKALLEKMHHTNSDGFVAAMVIERKRPQFLQKTFMVNENVRIPYEPRFKKSLEKVLNDLSRMGANISDIDYLIDQKGKFSFLDLDFWNMRTKRGVSGMGKLQDASLFGNYDNRRNFKTILLNIMAPPTDLKTRLAYAKEMFSDKYPAAYDSREIMANFALDSDPEIRRLTREYLRKTPDHWRGGTQASFLQEQLKRSDFKSLDKNGALTELLQFMMETEVKHDDSQLYYTLTEYLKRPEIQTPDLTAKLSQLYLKVPVDYRIRYVPMLSAETTSVETKQVLHEFFSLDPSPEVRRAVAELRGESLGKAPFIPAPTCIRLHDIVP